MKIKQILIEYCEANEKYDLYIDGEWCGKFYKLESAVKGIERGTRLVEHNKQRLKG